MADEALDEVQTSVYTTPDELTPKVAFQVLNFEKVANNSRPGEKSNRVFLKYSDNVKLMFYLPAKYKFLTDKDLADYDEKIEKNTNADFIVSKGYIGSHVVTDLLTKAKKENSSYPDFDFSKHELLSKKSKGRKSFSDGDEVSPKKKFKSE